MTVSSLACVGGSEFETIQSQLADIQLQVLQLQKQGPSKAEVQELGKSVDGQIQTLVKTQADFEVELRALTRQIERLESKLDDTNFRLAQLSQQIAATNQELQAVRSAAEQRPRQAPQEGPQTPIATDPQALYDRAYEDFQRGSYDLAVLGFRQYLDTFADSELADNATYWIGECYYRQQKFQKAVDQFDTVIGSFPDSERVPSAWLKKGYAYLALDQRAQGEVQLQHVVREYPGSDEAQLARQRLRDLGVDAGR